MKGFFEIKGTNYIGTPEGIMHTDKPVDQIGWRDFVLFNPDRNSGGEELASLEKATSLTFHHEVKSCDIGLLIDDICVATKWKNAFYDPMYFPLLWPAWKDNLLG